MKWVLKEDGGYVYDPATGEVWALNRTASFIVTRLLQDVKPGDVVDALVVETGIDHDTCKTDFNELLAELERLGCLCLSNR